MWQANYSVMDTMQNIFLPLVFVSGVDNCARAPNEAEAVKCEQKPAMYELPYHIAENIADI